MEFLCRQRRQEGLFVAGRDHAEAARALQPRSDGSNHFRARRAQRNAQARAAENFRLQAPQRGFVIGIKALGAGEVHVKVVERGGFHRRRVGLEDAAHALGKIRVVLVLPGHDDGFRANTQRFAEAHRGFHAEHLRLVACRSHTAAPHQHGLAAQPGIQHLLDRSEKRVHVHVHDAGDFEGGRFAQSQPGPGGPGVFLRGGFGLRSFRPRRISGVVAGRRSFGATLFFFRFFRGGNAFLQDLDGGGENCAFDTDVHGGS